MIETLVLATHNQGKVKEFAEMLGELVGSSVSNIKSAADFDLPEPEETEDTFVGNALLKARAACEKTGVPCLADDSGLAVDALDGAPGIYSARWAETSKGRDFNVAMERVNNECEQIDGTQTARFVAVLALVYPDGREEVFEGTVEGNLTWPARGDKGFGYDPIFVPNGHEITFAEMDSSDKHAMSHRANAVQKFKTYLRDNV
ncbi:MAG: RdgB/HAM1 family non-canonical purine NTP pyrophosphatase [Alphaproteobacteria bacterium]|nr:RdgB/HAM1 family non-canonical purine NTP pyrophosphatase [Alphaproteobacteria bacterium]